MSAKSCPSTPGAPLLERHWARLASLLAPQQEISHDLLEEVLAQDIARARHHLRQAALVFIGRHGLTVHPVICRAAALSSPPGRLAALRVAVVAALTSRLDRADEVDHFRSMDTLIGHASALLKQAGTVDDAILLGRLAGHHYVAGRSAVAAPLFRQQYQIIEPFFGADHPDVLTSLSNLAGALRAQGQLNEAQDLQTRILDASRRTLGPEHPDTHAGINNLAETSRALGDIAAALTLHCEALEIRRRLLGEEHAATLTSMSNLAGTLRASGKLEEARVLQQKVLDICRRSKGANHFDTSVAMNNLAETLRALGLPAEALPLQQDVAARFQQLFGDEHPSTLTARNNLALILEALGDLASARDELDQIVKLRRRALGNEHPDTLIALGNLASERTRRRTLPMAPRSSKELRAPIRSDGTPMHCATVPTPSKSSKSSASSTTSMT
jgi:tetratricopeptide (TPR) repeat protein